MWIFHKSQDFSFVESENENKIYLFCFEEKSSIKTLKKNVENKYIDKIFIFTTTERKNTAKINYIVYKSKPFVKLFLNYIVTSNINGYVIIKNAPVYFDDSLGLLKKSEIPEKKTIFAINSFYEENHTRLSNSTDTIIFHSSHNILDQYQKAFIQKNISDLNYRLLYLFYVLGYNLFNISNKLKSYCLDNKVNPVYSEMRRLINQERKNNKLNTQVPLIFLESYNNRLFDDTTHKKLNNNYNLSKDNKDLYLYIKNKFDTNNNFIIPRIAGIENRLIYTILYMPNSRQKQHIISRFLSVLKNNAGILIPSNLSLDNFKNGYLKSFEYCDIYTDWNPLGSVAAGSHQFFIKKYCKKKSIWAFTYDIYHNIFNKPWTHALQGKRILIISSFVESYKKKYESGILPNIYGVDLFPECKLLFLQPPQTQGENNSDDWMIELERFLKKIEKIKDDFDIALCSCGGYGNPLLTKIYEMGKSAIYVGGVLQMYFGVLGKRWIRERPDILRLFMNQYWTRPLDSEKPKNFLNIEGSSYW